MRVLLPLLACACALLARNDSPLNCGTDRARPALNRFLHNQSRLRRATGTLQSLAMPSASSNHDVQGVALINDADGVVNRLNPFTLSQKSLRFTPDGLNYRIETATAPAYASAGSLLPGVGDDDSRPISLPFPFPFFGVTYTAVFLNSDGNLTFTASDNSSSDRSLARFNAGPPRIAPLFSDLDPSRSGAAVKMEADAMRLTLTWDSVPVYTDSGIGARQSFQVRLFPDGVIEFAYSNVFITGSTAVVGITAGGQKNPTELLALAGANGHTSAGGAAEFFSDVDELDVAAAAQKFFATHEDSYDYIFFFNDLHLYINNGGVIAFEDTVRNTVLGYGVDRLDNGVIFGSPGRLQAAMNMGPIEQYPSDPYGLMPARSGTGDTGLSVLGHEAGHRFLAWTSVRDDNGVGIMWGRSNVHWSFNFNSEASVDEGNRIRDNGVGVTPRFTTTATAEGYSPLDQYLFGLRAPEDVPPVFAVLDSNLPNASAPRSGVGINGRRFDISVQDVIAVAGARVPDAAVAQRNFRFAFVLVESAMAPASAEAIALVARYRSQWTSYWNQITGGRSTADVQPARALKVSFWPQAELDLNATLEATIAIAAPLDHDLVVAIESKAGIVTAASPVTVWAGETTTSFSLKAANQGVEEITLRPEDGAFEVVQTRIRVSESTSRKQ